MPFTLRNLPSVWFLVLDFMIFLRVGPGLRNVAMTSIFSVIKLPPVTQPV